MFDPLTAEHIWEMRDLISQLIREEQRAEYWVFEEMVDRRLDFCLRHHVDPAQLKDLLDKKRKALHGRRY